MTPVMESMVKYLKSFVGAIAYVTYNLYNIRITTGESVSGFVSFHSFIHSFILLLLNANRLIVYQTNRLIDIIKIQLVVYCQCRVLIG